MSVLVIHKAAAPTRADQAELLSDLLQCTTAILYDRRGTLQPQLTVYGIPKDEAAVLLRSLADELDANTA